VPTSVCHGDRSALSAAAAAAAKLTVGTVRVVSVGAASTLQRHQTEAESLGRASTAVLSDRYSVQLVIRCMSLTHSLTTKYTARSATAAAAAAAAAGALVAQSSISVNCWLISAPGPARSGRKVVSTITVAAPVSDDVEHYHHQELRPQLDEGAFKRRLECDRSSARRLVGAIHLQHTRMFLCSN